jgi:mycothiol synthase
MSGSPRLSVPDLADPAQRDRFLGVAEAARQADGYDPFNEQTRLDLAAGRREPVLFELGGDAVGGAAAGGGELDLVIAPRWRRQGIAGAALGELLVRHPDTRTAWSHGDHPGARALAGRFGFEATRTLLRLRLPLDGSAVSEAPDAFERFRPGVDEDEWVALNARVFAFHPEQGSVTADDVRDREAEEWFDAGDFLVARDEEGRMIAYNWLKLEPGSDEGEIYVIGVDAGAAGRGLGRRLMSAGLARLRERGASEATLYVESDNEPAVRLYRSMGFADDTVDVQYERRSPQHPANIA